MEQILQSIQNANYSTNFTDSGLMLLVYILQAWALYTIAKRREIKKPWLAWIPVVNVWILGSISDQYQYVVKGKVKNKRKVLVGLEIATIAIVVALIVIIIVGFFTGLLAMEPSSNSAVAPMESDAIRDMMGMFLTVILFALAVIVLSIVGMVYTYMALYDVYCSSDPKNSTLFIVLSIVGNFVIEGVCCIFLMLCKDKDAGMPPRKVVQEAPAEIPETAEEVPSESPENTEE